MTYRLGQATVMQMNTNRTKKVLVVDDDPDIVSLLTIQLQKKGYHVVEAMDGISALTMAKKEKPDLIILDVMMPGKSGWEVAKEVRHDSALGSAKILMLTAIGEHLNELTSPLYGADDYLDKPFQVDELQKKITHLIGLPS